MMQFALEQGMIKDDLTAQGQDRRFPDVGRKRYRYLRNAARDRHQGTAGAGDACNDARLPRGTAKIVDSMSHYAHDVSLAEATTAELGSVRSSSFEIAECYRLRGPWRRCGLPSLHHSPAIGHPLCSVVGAPHFVSFDVRKLAFNPVTVALI
jgi:hypothetical protein